MSDKRKPIHLLKIDKEPLEEILYGNKKAEFRYNDRDFKVYDLVILQEYCQQNKIYPVDGKHLAVKITHIQEGYGIPEGYVMFSFERI